MLFDKKHSFHIGEACFQFSQKTELTVQRKPQNTYIYTYSKVKAWRGYGLLITPKLKLGCIKEIASFFHEEAQIHGGGNQQDYKIWKQSFVSAKAF
jgi:hypothetical protein